MKKVIISPSNSRAIAFFEDLNKKKEERKKKFEAKAIKILRPNTSVSQ
jgi:hypothetical protein